MLIRPLHLLIFLQVLFLGFPVGLLPSSTPEDTRQPMYGNSHHVVASDQAVLTRYFNDVEKIDKGWSLNHPQYRATFTDGSVKFIPVSGAPVWESISDDEQLVEPVYDGNKIIFDRGHLKEEYLLQKNTIEQQFVLTDPTLIPEGDLTIKGAIRCAGVLHTNKAGWSWKNDKGEVTLSDVYVYDADLKNIPAKMTVTSNEYAIRVNSEDLENAAFPVTIDPVIGTNDFKISTTGPNGDNTYSALDPAIAYNAAANRYLVVWEANSAGRVEIWGQLLNGSTYAADGPILVISNMGPDGDANFDALDPDVASSGGGFLVVWHGDHTTNEAVEIYGQLVSSSGTLSGNDFRISDMGISDTDINFVALAPAVVYNKTEKEFLVTWYGDDNSDSFVDGEFEIYIQRVDSLGVEQGVDVRISDMGGVGFVGYNALNPDVAWNSTDNQYIVVWHGDDAVAPLVDGENEIFLQRLNGDTGAPIGSNDKRISDMGPDANLSYQALNPSITYNKVDNNYLVVWQGDDDAGGVINDETEIYGQLITNLGEESGTDFRISNMGADGNANFDATNAAVNHDDKLNQFLVSWHGDQASAPVIDNEFEIYVQVITGSGTLIGNDVRISDVGGTGITTIYNGADAALAYNSLEREFLVVWEADDNDSGMADNEFEIFGQVFAELHPEPSAQATSPVFSARTSSSFTVTFTAATGSPDGYLVLRKSGSSPTDIPADHFVYNVGDVIGSSSVAYVGNALTFNQSSLSANTSYFYDFFSYNGVNSSTNYQSVTPLEGNVTTLATEPTTQAHTINFTAFGTNSVTFNFTNGNGSSRVIVAKSGGAVDNFPLDGNSYTADNVFASGTNLGSSNYVVGSGSGPITVTGLSSSTTYHFRVFELNGTASETNYLTTTASGNPSSKSTLAVEPSAQPTTLTFNNVTSSSMDGAFTAATGPPAGYLVLRKANSSPTDVPVDGTTYSAGGSIGTSTVAFSGASTSFSNTGLSAATDYHYDVFAYNGSGSSINYVTTSPLQGNKISTSAQPSAQPTTFVFSAVTSNSMDGSFTAASGTPDGYIVLRKTTSSPTDVPVDRTAYTAGNTLGSSFIVSVGSTTTFSSTGLTAGTVYFYDVFSYNGSGETFNYLETSPLEKSQTTLAAQPASSPSALVFSAHTTSGYTVNFTAAPDTPTGYLVLRRQALAPTGAPSNGIFYTVGDDIGDGEVVAIGSSTTFNETALSSGTAYHYKIFAYNGASASTHYRNTSPASGSTITLCSAPLLNDAADINQTSFSASWPSVTGAVEYLLELSTDDFATFIDGYNPKTLAMLEEIIEGLPSGTTFKFRVRAQNASGQSANSTAKVVTTVPATPSLNAPDPLRQNGFDVNWNAVTGATKYLIDVSTFADFQSFVPGYNAKEIFSASHSFTDLSPGIEYFLRLRASNNGGVSPYSGVVAQKTLPQTPEVLSVDAADVSVSSFKAKWVAAQGAESYELQVSADDFLTFVNSYGPKEIFDALEEVVAGLTAKTSYKFRVRSKSSVGHSPYSISVPVETKETVVGSFKINTVAVSEFSVAGSGTFNRSVNVSGGTGAKTVILHYRSITGDDFHDISVPFKSGEDYEVTLDESIMDELGMEYFFEATDESGTTLTQASHSFLYRAIGPQSPAVSIPFSSGFNGKQNTYQMFSIPYKLNDDDIADLFETALNGYDPVQWRMFHYDGNGYLEYPGQFRKIATGDAYWFNTKTKDFLISITAAVVVQANQIAPFQKALHPGWNQIGNPYPFNIDWSAVTGRDGLGALWFFSNGTYNKSTVLKPWTGAFIHADEAVTISIPVLAKTSSSGRTSDDDMPADLDAAEWLLPISLRIHDLHHIGGVGMHPEARASKDKFDEITVPRFLDFVEMNTRHDEFFSPDFSTDVQPTGDEHVWEFEIKSNLGDAPGELRWDQSSIALNKSSLILIDLTDQKAIDMKTVGVYSFVHKPGRVVRIIFNRDGEIKPGMKLLGEAFPNPFTSIVNIPVLVDEPGFVQVEIYDGFGRLVTRVGKYFSDSGFQEISWDSRSDTWAGASAGILFYRLTGTGDQNMKRLIKK